MAESQHGVDRRSFVFGVVAAIGGVIAVTIGLPAIGYLISPSKKEEARDDWVPIGPVQELPLDQPQLFTFTRTNQTGWETTAKSFGVYVTRNSDGSYYVFSNICTHLSCRVTWENPPQEYICPCHDGRFAPDGSIISGPQPRELYTYEYEIDEEGIMFVKLVEV